MGACSYPQALTGGSNHTRLWGNPSHLVRVREALEQRHRADRLHVLVVKRNSDNHTYDGIEVGGERVAQEIEDELKELEVKGNRITKLSIVGYSLGGLVARYSIGLLFSRGWFDKLQPVNFTAFASPFLGVRTPNKGYHSAAYNLLASQLLSASGRQLFLVDQFRDSGRALLEVMTDPTSIFIAGLKAFKHRALYANIINDRSAPWFTTGISRSDPFVDLDAVQLNYMPGHDSVLLDPANPVQRKPKQELGFYARAVNSGSALVSNLPVYALMGLLMPIGFTVFTVNAGIQTIRSNHRVALHNAGQAGSYDAYRLPYLLEGAFESMNSAETQGYLSESDSAVDLAANSSDSDSIKKDADSKSVAEKDAVPNPLYRTRSRSEFPVLAMDERQFRMIEVLNEVGFNKYPVHIAKARHSHAAIIVRKNWKNMEEGYVVLKHWLDHEFEV